MRREHLRPIIVLLGGAALTAITAFALSGVLGTLGTASLVLFGVSLTLATLSVVPVHGARLHWPIGPGAVFSIMGWMFMVEAAALPAIVGVVWPVILIAFFAWDVSHSRDHLHDHGTTPAMHA